MDINQLVDIEEKVTINIMSKPYTMLLGNIYYELKRYYILLDKSTTKEKLGIGGGTNGEIVFFYVDENSTFQEIMFTALHEAIHVLSRHIGGSEGKNPMIWNLAIDHVTNGLVVHIGNKTSMFDVDKKHYVFFDEIEEKYPKADADFVYKLLLDKYKNKEFNIELIEIPISGQMGEGGKQLPKGCGEPPKQDGNSQDGDSQDSDSNGEDDKSDGKPDNSNSNSKHDGNGDGDTESDQEGNVPKAKFLKYTDKNGNVQIFPYDMDIPEGTKFEEAKAKEETLHDRARAQWQNSNGMDKGDETSDLAMYLDNIFKVEIPWDELTKEAILFPVQNYSKRTWEMPNIVTRKIVRLPGKGKKSNNPHTLFAAIDSSGSVGDGDLKTFIGTLVGSAAYYKKMTLYYHDTHASKPIYIQNMSEQAIIEQANMITKRGGTSHKDIFDILEEQYQDELISLAIFLTDFCSDVDEIYTNYKWIKQIPTVWVLNEKRKVKLQNVANYKTIYIDSF